MSLKFSYRDRKTLMNSLDPVSKMIWLFCVGILSLAFGSTVLQTALLISVLLVAFIMSKVPSENFIKLTKFFFAFCTSWFIIQTLFSVPGRIVLAQVWIFTITSEALDFAGATAIRIYTIVLSSLVFVLTTSPRDIALALHQKLHLGYVLPHMIFLAMRFIPLVEEEFRNIVDAHKVRGCIMEKGLRGHLRNIKRYTVPLLASNMKRARVIAWAMDSKGFRAFPNRTYLQQIDITWKGKVFTIMSVLLTVLMLYLFPGYIGYAVR